MKVNDNDFVVGGQHTSAEPRLLWFSA